MAELVAYHRTDLVSTITMDDGSAVILSVAKYYSPDGKSIQDNGVTPQELVADAEAGGTDVDNDDDSSEQTPKITGSDKKAGQAVSGGGDVKPTEDLILQKAIELAKKA